MTEPVARGSRFSIVRVLGRGGIGTVYEAIRETNGHQRRVALKLLDCSTDRRVLARFRDEARILSLLRDRAVVWADAPRLLSAGWAVVMDLAPGTDLARMIEACGPAPVPAAVEITGEVARALHHLWSAAGPDGPLKLVHRDLKPSNLQISRSGEVRILDFGNARASFSEREAHTTRHIGGTPGYIAPERLRGIDGPEGDIWSLGVLLREVLSPRSPGTPRTLPTLPLDLPRAEGPPDVRSLPIPEAVASLVEAMTYASPEHRPSAQQVARRCRELLRDLEGESLADWAERSVPLARSELLPDALVGHTLDEVVG